MTRDHESATPTARPTPDEYRDLLREHLAGLLERSRRSTHLPLSACAGSVLVEDLRAPVDLPLFVNSQMDGFAVRAADVAGASESAPARLRVVGTTRAGDPPGPGIDDDEARRIMTGAAFPEGADCVVPVEDTEVEGDEVLVRRPRGVGEFVRRPGDDVRAGDLVLSAGTRLAARHLAAAASLGVSGLDVRPRPRVAVLTTGAELVSPGRPLQPGQIWESNSLTLAAAARECGCEVTSTAVSSDDLHEFEHALHGAVSDADLVVTAGGVSMGDAEVVRQLLADRDGARFAPIAMQPGGPQGMATWRDTPVVCLPGNPVSALVSFVVLLRPVLLEAAGRDAVTAFRGRLARAVESPAGRVQYLRAALDSQDRDQTSARPSDARTSADLPTDAFPAAALPTADLPTVDPVSGPGSHLVAAMARADVLVEVPADVTSLPEGAEVGLLPL